MSRHKMCLACDNTLCYENNKMVETPVNELPFDPGTSILIRGDIAADDNQTKDTYQAGLYYDNQFGPFVIVNHQTRGLLAVYAVPKEETP